MAARPGGGMDGIFSSWARILGGYSPSLSIEITRECPLRCPGCYAYGDDHLGGVTTLRALRDLKGQALIDGVHALVDRHKPLHVSIVGGEPLVRYRELNELLPQLSARGLHVQVVTSAVRPIPAEWAAIPRLSVVVSIDGLPAEHDVRRAPATYDRILKHIAGQQVAVHCTVTRQLAQRSGYLEEFARFWQDQPHCRRIWFSLYTPQIGEESAEKLRPEDRREVVATLMALRERYKKIEMPRGMIEVYARSAGVARRMHLRAGDHVGVGRPRDARSRRASSADGRTARTAGASPRQVWAPSAATSWPAGCASTTCSAPRLPSARPSATSAIAWCVLPARSHPRLPPCTSEQRLLPMRRRVLLLVCLLSLPASLWAAIAITLPNAPDSVKFAVFGDSGSGAGRQYQLGAQLAAAHKLYPFSFVLMLGDNIYGRETAKDFFKKFELPYKAASRRRRALLRGARQPRRARHPDQLQAVQHGRQAVLQLPQGRRGVLRDRQHLHVDRAGAVGREGVVRVHGRRGRSPTCITRPTRPASATGPRSALRAFIEPLFIKYGVSVVLAGHEHFYERLKPQNGIAYFTSGAAGKLRAGNIRRGPYFEAGFDTDLSFMLFEQIGDDLHFQVISRLAATVDKGVVKRRVLP